MSVRPGFYEEEATRLLCESHHPSHSRKERRELLAEAQVEATLEMAAAIDRQTEQMKR